MGREQLKLLLFILCLGQILFAALASAKVGSRIDVRQAAGSLDAEVTVVRLFVRENVGANGRDLSRFKDEMLNEQIPALHEKLEALKMAIQILEDRPEAPSDDAVEILVESCVNKWTKLFATDKYLFRAIVTTEHGAQISKIDIRDPKDGDMDVVRIPAARDRSDGQPGGEYEIHDSFKTWGPRAELVVEDSNGREYSQAFACEK